MWLDVAFLLLVVTSVCLATSWTAEEYPNPRINPQKCLMGTPRDARWLCDPDAVFGSNDAAVILSEIQDVNANADCVCNCTDSPNKGYQVGVAAADGINGQLMLDGFSQEVRESWFGIDSCDGSILILLVRNSSQIYVALGSKMIEILPAKILDTIDREVEPKLQESQFKDAIEITLRSLDLAINENIGIYTTGTPTTIMTTDEPTPENNLVWGILGVIAIMSILIFHYWIKY